MSDPGMDGIWGRWFQSCERRLGLVTDDLGRLGLTPIGAAVLVAIAVDGWRSQTDVASRLQLSPPQCSRNIERLVRLGLVERVVDVRDRRSRSVVVTPSGLQLCDRVTELFEAVAGVRMLSTVDRDAISSLLDEALDGSAGDACGVSPLILGLAAGPRRHRAVRSGG